MPYEDQFTIEKDPRLGWQVLSPMGAPVGARFDFYSGEIKVPLEVVRNPYPRELNGGLGSPAAKLTKKQAETALGKLQAHIRTVRDKIPKSRRIGGSQFW